MKEKVKEQIYRNRFDEGDEIRFSDLPKSIQDDDIIEINKVEAFYSDNNSCEAYTELLIIREREETDEEYQNRLESKDLQLALLREMRYQSYLKMKAEFEQK